MKNLNFPAFLMFLLLAFVFAAFSPAAKAQETRQPDAVQTDKRDEPLFRQLNLSPEQIQKIRAIHLETRDQTREAAQKQRAARLALDAAIYAENPNAAEVEQRAREFGAAQAELSNLKARTEFRVRQVLNAEQLATFREVRRRASERVLKPSQPGFNAPRQNRLKRLPLKNRIRF